MNAMPRSGRTLERARAMPDDWFDLGDVKDALEDATGADAEEATPPETSASDADARDEDVMVVVSRDGELTKAKDDAADAVVGAADETKTEEGDAKRAVKEEDDDEVVGETKSDRPPASTSTSEEEDRRDLIYKTAFDAAAAAAAADESTPTAAASPPALLSRTLDDELNDLVGMLNDAERWTEVPVTGEAASVVAAAKSEVTEDDAAASAERGRTLAKTTCTAPGLGVDDYVDMILSTCEERSAWDAETSFKRVANDADDADGGAKGDAFVAEYKVPMLQAMRATVRLRVKRDWPSKGAVAYAYRSYDANTGALDFGSGATCGKGIVTPAEDGEKGTKENVDARRMATLTAVEELPALTRFLPSFALRYLLGSYAPRLFLGMVRRYKKHRGIE